jgi:hypothetical protein
MRTVPSRPAGRFEAEGRWTRDTPGGKIQKFVLRRTSTDNSKKRKRSC